jgi:GNAT superfamily N-acetyltransferase
VIIRQYQSTDEAACRTCVAELQDAERQIDPRLRRGDEMADEYLQHMHARCREFAGTILVAEHGSQVVGVAMVLARVPFESLDEPPGEYAIVAELVVRREFRGQGFGRALLNAAEQFAREAKATELRIAVLSQNHAAKRLYLAENFAPYSEVLAKQFSS